ncbi:uncharacterized protein LOC119685499 [Teleopsis dalmanni]|uniref:uncharacterized protein LOC119685499 n=1 Tax=Teleopsis dalmanni TaxID=139649 RepID=UPI0018CDDDF3|nr:uncharacterized protein LOC119685499 [Teleopsis dalmanni]
MSTVFLIIIFTILSAIIYVGLVLHKKKINIKDIRVHTVNDAKRLLTPPTKDNTLKYLEKAA